VANQLKMATVQSILSLHAQGWSQRRIAAAVGVDRETVSRYVRLAANRHSRTLVTLQTQPLRRLRRAGFPRTQAGPMRRSMQAAQFSRQTQPLRRPGPRTLAG
jgi:IS30 family transposase